MPCCAGLRSYSVLLPTLTYSLFPFPPSTLPKPHRAVYNRTPAKTAELVAKGARAAASPAEVAAASDIVFTIVGYPSDVRDVILGESGVLKALKPGGIVVDMTTSEPSLAAEIAAAAKAKGVASLDAPVSGGDIGAREARLSIMVGGECHAVTKRSRFQHGVFVRSRVRAL